MRDDIDGEDDEESYYRYIQENPNAGKYVRHLLFHSDIKQVVCDLSALYGL